MAASVPIGLLGWVAVQAAVPWLTAPVLAVAVGIAAAWGARVGVEATDRRGGIVGRMVLRVLRGVVLVGVAALTMVVSGTGAPAVRGPPLAVPSVLLITAFLAGRSIGRIHRRQADPLRTVRAHRSADAALMGALLTGVLVVAGIVTLAWAADGLVPPPAWIGVAWVLVAFAMVVGARPYVLRARAAMTGPPDGDGWTRTLLPVLGVTVLLVAVAAIALAAGAESALRAALPQMPAVQLDLLDGTAGSPASAPSAPAPPSRRVIWQIAALLALALAIVIGPVRRRRGQRRVRPGHGMSLLMFLRSLFAFRRDRTTVDAPDEVLAARTPPPDDVGVRAPPPAWTRLLRRRPRDPEAAILYDYRQVQRRLPPSARRRSSETVLAHATRSGAAALDELAGLVCAIRYAGREATAADAARSRELARQLRSR
ncbi:MAG TPA: hypothetical protein VFZ70_07285 [Euzebyales bacterium]